MDAQTALAIGREALSMLVSLSFPVVLAVLVVGLIVATFQALTQLQEPTLSFVPKLIAAVIVLVLIGPWMLSTLVDYIKRVIEAIPRIVS